MLKNISLKHTEDTRKLVFKSLFWISLGVILFLALSPKGVELSSQINDKINHGVAFFVLSFLARRTYANHYRKILIFLLIYGLSIEIVQYFLPYREFSLFDMLANISGIAAYIVIEYIIRIMR